jgi:hypothetical protein
MMPIVTRRKPQDLEKNLEGLENRDRTARVLIVIPSGYERNILPAQPPARKVDLPVARMAIKQGG